MNKRIFILGSTGSIGTNAVAVIQHLQQLDGKDAWQVVGLSAGSNSALLAEQARMLSVSAVALVEGDVKGEVAGGTHEYTGEHASVAMLKQHARAGDLVLAAIVGFAGVKPVMAAIEIGCDIALANKETLVAAGEIVMDAAAQAGVRILPVDSEHAAIFQCLGGTSMEGVRSIVLTASGGSLRDHTQEEIATATVAEVLNHPTWKMGAKVTVDSASLMNKALEMIEAHWLFGASNDQIEAVIHRESLVHGLVEFNDGSMTAQLAPPDMKLPIQYALTWPARRDGDHRSCHWSTLSALHFEPIDEVRFPAISLGREVILAGGTAGAILSAANEIAVAGFLKHALPFGSIVRIVRQTLETIAVTSASSLDAVTAADQESRSVATELIAALTEKELA
jgi:1-deoxy-D-xylulose-5-phosphate reductoisomerase